MPDWTMGEDKAMEAYRGESIYDQEPDMAEPLEQAMRNLAGDLSRYLTADVDFIERRLQAIEVFTKDIGERVVKTRSMAAELARMAAQREEA